MLSCSADAPAASSITSNEASNTWQWTSDGSLRRTASVQLGKQNSHETDSAHPHSASMSTSELPQGWLETASASRGPAKLFYRETQPGQRPTAEGSLPVVLLHGLCGGSGEWKAIMEAQGDSQKMYALDLPGHCQSPMLDEDYSMPTITHDILHTLDQIGIDRCVIVGYSLGARLAVPVALGLGRRCCGIVIEDLDMIPRIGGIEQAELDRCRSFEQWHRTKDEVYSELQKFGYDRSLVDRMLFNGVIHQQEKDGQMMWYIGVHPLVSKLEYHEILACEDCEPLFAELNNAVARRPVALVRAEENSAISRWGLRLMRHMVPESSIITFPGSDYAAHLSKPKEFCDFLAGFVDNCKRLNA